MSTFLEILANHQFLSIAFVQMLTVFSTNILAPVLPVHLKLAGMSESEIGFVMGIVSLGALLVRPWTGWSVDVKGSRPTVLFGQLLTIAGIAGFLWLTGFWPLLLLRFFQGIAMAFYGTGSVTFASYVETPERSSTAIAYFSMFTMIGMGVGTSLAPLLYQTSGFTVVTMTSLATAVLALAAMWQFTSPQPRGESKERVPFQAVLHQPLVVGSSACLFASNFSLGTAFTFVPLLALELHIAGYYIFFIAFSVAVVSARFGVQYLNTRWKPEQTAVYASFMNALGVLLLAFFPSAAMMTIAGVLLGLGFGIIYPTLAGYLVQRVNPANRGTALSILSGASDIGNALGASALGVVAEVFGFTAVFAAAGLVILLCVYYFRQKTY